MMVTPVKYIGTSKPFFELPITGGQASWMPGQIRDRSDADAALLVASGNFSKSTTNVVDDNADSTDGNGSAVSSVGNLLKASLPIGIFGDSIAAEQTSAGYTNAVGSLCWAQALSGMQFSLSHSLNFGVNGNTTRQMLDRIGPVIAAMQAAGCFAVWVSAGTNDGPNGAIAPTQTITNFKSICTQFRDAGIMPMLRADPARSAANWGAYPAGITEAPRINAVMRAWVAAQPRMFFIDSYGLYSDPTSATGDPFANMTRDGLHPTARGGFMEGLLLSKLMARWFLRTNYPAGASRVGHFHATNNPFGNFLNGGSGADYGAMAGSNALTGTGYAGNWADGIGVSRLAGTGTITGSKESAALLVDGVDVGLTYPRQVCTFSGMAGDETFQIRYNLGWDATYRAWATGDQIFAEWEIETATVANLVGVKALITEGWGSFLSVTGMDEGGRTEVMPTNSQTWVVRSPVITLSTYTSGGLICDLQIKCNGGAAVSGALKFGRPRLVKVPA